MPLLEFCLLDVLSLYYNLRVCVSNRKWIHKFFWICVGQNHGFITIGHSLDWSKNIQADDPSLWFFHPFPDYVIYSGLTEHMAPLIHFGIDGLKAPKTRKVADAGYFDDRCWVTDNRLLLPIVHRGFNQTFQRFRFLLLAYVLLMLHCADDNLW